MGLLLLLLIGIAIGAYLVFFSFDNAQTVSLNLLGGWYLHDVVVWQLVVVCLAIGLVIAVLLLWPAQLRTLLSAKSYRNELKRTQALLEEERHQHALAAAPIAPAAPPGLPQPMEESAGGHVEGSA